MQKEAMKKEEILEKEKETVSESKKAEGSNWDMTVPPAYREEE